MEVGVVHGGLGHVEMIGSSAEEARRLSTIILDLLALGSPIQESHCRSTLPRVGSVPELEQLAAEMMPAALDVRRW